MKKAWGAFSLAFLSLGLVVLQAKHMYRPDNMIVIIAFLPVVIAVLQGIHYMKRADMEYIYMAEDKLYIYRGPFLPREKIDYRYIDYCVEVYEKDRKYMKIQLKDSPGDVQIHTEWLSPSDLKQFKTELQRRTKEDKLFRTKTI
ncbi:hypothetical protein [Ornithinibacillus salinisoli]